MPKFARRRFLHLAVGAAALPFAPHPARAQAYPTRPVRIVVGAPPAGPNDIYARLFAQWLSDRLGQQFIVENRPGAAGTIAAEGVVRAPPDGYTLFLAGGSDVRAISLYDNLKFNFVRDLAPVARFSSVFNVLTVHPSFSAKTVSELIAMAKADPGKITVGSSDIGSASHLNAELFKAMAGVNMLLVKYRGEAPALTDLIAGQIQVVFPTLVASIAHIKGGTLRALAVTGATRSPVLPNIPTIGEFVSGYEVSGWLAIVAPKNTPTEIIDKLNREINLGLADPRIRQRIADFGDVPAPMTVADFSAFIVSYHEKWSKIIRDAGIKAE
jgi:tripartite-type tricarboxylate transporter receptor subunit TctC